MEKEVIETIQIHNKGFKKKTGLSDLLKKLRSKSTKGLSLEDITKEVEDVIKPV